MMSLFDLEVQIRKSEQESKLLAPKANCRVLLLGKKEWRLLQTHPDYVLESNVFNGLTVRRSGFESLIMVMEEDDDL